ncbi:MAG: phage integrase SAM-like domain-containing protein, partial [Candidatus Contubernalis sp.]|nr:phage integrase SAM-like domain-containing protein [Candidatus Contubernalis sp.]
MSVKINRTAGLKYALASTINYWKSGIGTSRLAVQQEKKGLSPFIHSYSTFKRYVGCLNDLKKFCGEAYVRKLNQITPRTLEAFFKYKSTRGKGSENQPRFLSEKTMRIHLSVQCKFFALVNRPD